MLSSTQIMAIIILSLLMVYTIIDRICKCIENNEKQSDYAYIINMLLNSKPDSVNACSKFLKGSKENGDKPL